MADFILRSNLTQVIPNVIQKFLLKIRLIFFWQQVQSCFMMKLTSPAFREGEIIPSVYTCEGKNWNPPLEIENVPKSAVSLVLIMEDPDVPPSVRSDRMWDHWVIFNIPASEKKIKENSTPPGIQGKNTSGKNQYEGPCPPDREHRYFFNLYALNKSLDLKPGAAKAQVEHAMKDHILASAKLMGRYEKGRGY